MPILSLVPTSSRHPALTLAPFKTCRWQTCTTLQKQKTLRASIWRTSFLCWTRKATLMRQPLACNCEQAGLLGLWVCVQEGIGCWPPMWRKWYCSLTYKSWVVCTVLYYIVYKLQPLKRLCRVRDGSLNDMYTNIQSCALLFWSTPCVSRKCCATKLQLGPYWQTFTAYRELFNYLLHFLL